MGTQFLDLVVNSSCFFRFAAYLAIRRVHMSVFSKNVRKFQQQFLELLNESCLLNVL